MAEAFTAIPPLVTDLVDPYGIAMSTDKSPDKTHPANQVNWAIEKTTEKLNTLAPDFRNRIIQLLREAYKLGYLCYVYSGRRDFALQKQLYEKYTAGKGLVAARPGESKHNFGRAIDVQVLTPKGGQLTGGLKLLDTINRKLNLFLEWGASYNDPNHFEDNAISISELQKIDPDYQTFQEADPLQVADNKKNKELKDYFAANVVGNAITWRERNLSWIPVVGIISLAGLIVLIGIKVRYSK